MLLGAYLLAGSLMTPAQFEEMLIRHEGVALTPYYCSSGALTIGVGRNLDAHGISVREAKQLMRNDVQRTEAELKRAFPVVSRLDSVRYYVLLNMAYNMGVPKLGTFHEMWNAVEKQDWSRAADEMLDSRWAVQVKGRATELAEMMRFGSYTY